MYSTAAVVVGVSGGRIVISHANVEIRHKIVVFADVAPLSLSPYVTIVSVTGCLAAYQRLRSRVDFAGRGKVENIAVEAGCLCDPSVCSQERTGMRICAKPAALSGLLFHG